MTSPHPLLFFVDHTCIYRNRVLGDLTVFMICLCARVHLEKSCSFHYPAGMVLHLMFLHVTTVNSLYLEHWYLLLPLNSSYLKLLISQSKCSGTRTFTLRFQ